jgi:hypothetical protein
MLTLVESKHLSSEMAIEVAQKINVVNPIYITLDKGIDSSKE